MVDRTRRRLLRSGMLGGAMLAGAGLGVSSCGPEPRRPADAGGVTPPVEPAPFALEELTLVQLQSRLTSGEETARSLVEQYLARIEALDRQGPELGSIIELNPEILELADASDAERRSSGPRGPLHGIPILLKDNIETADRMTTTAGSLALAGAIAPRDATVAARLRAAGALLVGKANLSEWANFRSTHSTSGWSARGGQCRNPYALDRNPSGSSSGSGAATAANLVAAAIGTETDGSIVSPASHCSLVGIKPTLGFISRAGIVPIAHSQDTAGPMTRTVADAALLLGVLVGVDARDPLSREGEARAVRDFTASLDPQGLRGARLGVVRQGLFGRSPKVDRVVEAALGDLKRLGADLVDPADIPTLGTFDDSEFEVLLYEFKADLEAYFTTLPESVSMRTLADLIAFNEANRDREMPYFGQEILEMARQRGPLSTPAYREALARNHRLSRTEGIDAVLTRHRLDALVAPTGSLPGLIDLVNGDSGYFGASTTPAVAGYPHVTVPAGYVAGLPVGLSFIGGAWREADLVRYAFAYEQATRHRVPPRLRPTVDLG
jgi:amidase